jgi:hypothetical protein
LHARTRIIGEKLVAVGAARALSTGVVVAAVGSSHAATVRISEAETAMRGNFMKNPRGRECDQGKALAYMCVGAYCEKEVRQGANENAHHRSP